VGFWRGGPARGWQLRRRRRLGMRFVSDAEGGRQSDVRHVHSVRAIGIGIREKEKESHGLNPTRNFNTTPTSFRLKPNK
jgi:hypothetical protein